MIGRLRNFVPVALAGLSLAAPPAALAEDIKLPPTMAVTAYDTGTAGFNIAVGVGKMMKDKYGTDVRVLPAGNDVARLAPLRAKRAVMSAMGSGTYFAQEGVFEFGVKEWGPQALQVLLSSIDCNAGALGVAADAGVKEMKDLKGKRIGFVVGSPALNQNTLAYLAFADLKQSDVKIVEFAGYGAMWKGLINNDADAAFGTTITGPGEGSRDIAARPGLAAAAGQGQRRLGAAEESRRLFLPAACHLRCRDHAGEADRARKLPLPDLRGLCLATGGSDLCHHQGHDHRLRRLQGFRTGRGRACCRQADQELGGSGSPRRGEGAERGQPMDRRAGNLQQWPAQTPGSAGNGVGGLWQVQSALG